jgi:hypothetical protein
MIILILFAILLASFILFKVISKSIAGRKRREAEERARRELALRDWVIVRREEPELSEEERIHSEKVESVANTAKEHPEDTALLIRRLMQEDPATYKEAILQESKELILANNLIKTVGSDKSRELLEKTLGSQKAIDLINLLTRNSSPEAKADSPEAKADDPEAKANGPEAKADSPEAKANRAD